MSKKFFFVFFFVATYTYAQESHINIDSINDAKIKVEQTNGRDTQYSSINSHDINGSEITVIQAGDKNSEFEQKGSMYSLNEMQVVIKLLTAVFILIGIIYGIYRKATKKKKKRP